MHSASFRLAETALFFVFWVLLILGGPTLSGVVGLVLLSGLVFTTSELDRLPHLQARLLITLTPLQVGFI